MRVTLSTSHRKHERVRPLDKSLNVLHHTHTVTRCLVINKGGCHHACQHNIDTPQYLDVLSSEIIEKNLQILYRFFTIISLDKTSRYCEYTYRYSCYKVFLTWGTDYLTFFVLFYYLCGEPEYFYHRWQKLYWSLEMANQYFFFNFYQNFYLKT